MAYFSESYEKRKETEGALFKKWEKALNIDGGIRDEHMARTTAICLENYLTYLNNTPQLMAEDQISTGNFSGINLALLGLIARVIPTLVGAELVGIQAMPTPKSPIFTMRWYYNTNKGQTTAGNEMWLSPTDANFPYGLDPNYSGQIIIEDIAALGTAQPFGFAGSFDNLKALNPKVLPGSIYVTWFDANNTEIAQAWLNWPNSFYPTDNNFVAPVTQNWQWVVAPAGSAPTPAAGEVALSAVASADFQTNGVYSYPVIDVDQLAVGGAASAQVKYEYRGEADPNTPEISFKITDVIVDVLRRQLRGKYTLDSAYDLEKLHGLNVDTELTNMMKTTLQGEINREIVQDLRSMAAIVKTVNMNDPFNSTGTGMGITYNYDDAMKMLLDAINTMAAHIFSVGRLGKANWVLGNPVTLAFLDRVPGFVGAGVNYNGKELSFYGTLGGKMKFYIDPLYPTGEFLIGYKGPGAIDTGYIHAPYLPILSTPQLVNWETGDPSKIFYTRYGKTYNVFAPTASERNKILMGEFQYGRLIIQNLPRVFS